MEIITTMVKMVYNPKKEYELEYSKACVNLWLYASKEVARRVDNLLDVLHDEKRGDKVKKLQESICVMRKDIQIWPWQKKLEPEEVKHLYSIIVEIHKQTMQSG